jgi:hypothetical protein
MHAVQDAFGEDVEIINNRNQKVDTIDLLQWSNPLIHKKQFKTYQKTTGRDQRRRDHLLYNPSNSNKRKPDYYPKPSHKFKRFSETTIAT